MCRARTRNRTECDYLSERARVWSQPRFLIPQSGIRNDNLGMCATRNERMEDSLRGAEGEEILGAFDGVLQAAEELLQVVAALDEIDLRSIDHEKVGSGVAEKEVFVGAGDLFDVFERDVRLFARGFLGDARAEDFRLGLQINDKVGGRQIGGEKFVVALVELEFVVVEIEIGEDAVLFEEKVGEQEARGFDGEGVAK